ncbi:EexN family lipoprotein [Candidatus Enterovibrio escicola]|uniref:EexN family lipoprotein n=1 Tax=Candidatus Enterovibrio escicola TaxID=1927127 RepID=UPI0012383372|nr:EexN family lipoprotein [Candidatus Enterovibrio escacola]
MFQYLRLLLLAIVLVGCGEATYDVDYYASHDTERLEKLDWCKKSMDRKLLTNCLNALDADTDIKVNKMFEK